MKQFATHIQDVVPVPKVIVPPPPTPPKKQQQQQQQVKVKSVTIPNSKPTKVDRPPKVKARHLLDYIERELEELDKAWAYTIDKAFQWSAQGDDEMMAAEFIHGRMQSLIEILVYFGYDISQFVEHMPNLNAYTNPITATKKDVSKDV